MLATVISAFLRSRYLSGQFWMDEALSVGISSHSLSSIPTVLRHDGSPPLYYLMLHVWMSVFGSSESATHALSLLFGLLTVPVGAWAAWSLFGRWAAVIAGVLFALNPFLTAYSQETRMYTLMTLLGLLASTAFIHAFIYRRRKYLVLFVVSQALMLYTHAWGIFFGIGSAPRPDPDLVGQRRATRDPEGRADRVRRGGDPVRPLAADAALPGHTHGLAVGHRAELRRPGADLAQPDGRRPGDDRARARRRDRAGAAVLPRALAQPRVADAVGPDPRARRDAGRGLGRLAHLTGLAVPVLRPDPRGAAALLPGGSRDPRASA